MKKWILQEDQDQDLDNKDKLDHLVFKVVKHMGFQMQDLWLLLKMRICQQVQKQPILKIWKLKLKIKDSKYQHHYLAKNKKILIFSL